MEYTGTFTITRKEVSRFTRRIEWSRKQRGIIILSAIGMVAGNFVLRVLWKDGLPSFWPQVVCSLIGGLLVFGLCYGMLCYSVAKSGASAYSAGSRWNYEQTIVINALGVTCQTENGSSHADFDELTVEECPEAFYIFTSPSAAWILPKEQMRDLEDDSAFIRKIFTTMAQPDHLNLRKTKA